MAKVRTLADELPSLVEVEVWLPKARDELARLRSRARSILTSVALANQADSSLGGPATLLAACDAACDSIAKQLEDAAARAAVVRAYVDGRSAAEPSFAIPTEVRNTWGEMTMAKICAVDELTRLRVQLES
jgi:hypothetical protein